MDGQRFDALTRALAAGTSRRRLLGVTLASAVAAIGGAILPRSGRAEGAFCGVTCADSGENCDGATDGCYTCCDPLCVDLTSDVFNCGNCGVVCAGGEYAVCINGGCFLQCPAGSTPCGDGSYCADLTSDMDNCQSCGSACVSPNDACCPDGCAWLDRQVNNCGACGNVCDDGFDCCGGSCVAIAGDDRFCGSCDVACSPGQRCENGVCGEICAPGTVFCDPDCVDLTSDRSNCGACGIVCDGSTQCRNGACIRPECPGGQTRCQDGCFDLTTDANHCGGCNNVCINGGGCCGGACFDLATDPANCGECGRTCPPGFRCDGKGCTRESSATGSAGGQEVVGPEFCQVEPRPYASLKELHSVAIPTIAPTPSWAEVTKGSSVVPKPAKAAFTQTIHEVVRQISACGNADDPSRQTALMTDAYAASMLAGGALGDALRAVVAGDGQDNAVPGGVGGAPLPRGSWELLGELGDVFHLGDDRASVAVTYGALIPFTEPRDEVQVFAKRGDRWLLDAVHRRVDAAVSTSGSVLLRLFECPAGATAGSIGGCPPMPELRIDAILTTGDGSKGWGLSDAAFEGAGLFSWPNLAPGAYVLRFDAGAAAISLEVVGARLNDAGGYAFTVGTLGLPRVIDVYREKGTLAEIAARLPVDSGCPPCNRKDSFRGVCIPTCPPCSGCKSVDVGNGTMTSSCVGNCSESQICVSAGGSDPFCCVIDGAICAVDADCCLGACIDGVCGCVGDGGSCGGAGGASCCAGFTCATRGVCAACTSPGGACAAGAECCGGACADGVCRCCAGGVDDPCCEEPLALLVVAESASGPGFKRCCTIGIDCAGDPEGPPLADAGVDLVWAGDCRSHPA